MEERLEARVVPDEVAVGAHRRPRERVHHLAARLSRVARNRGEQRRRDGALEVAIRKTGEAVLERDRLALLGQLQPSRGRVRRLREDRGPRRPAAAARRAAAAVEDRQLDAAGVREHGEPLLRAEDLPVGGEEAAVLAGVGVADHHLEPAARLAIEIRTDDGVGVAQIVDRLEQRNRLEVETGLARELVGRGEIVDRLRHRHDQAVEGFAAVTALERRRCGEHLEQARLAAPHRVDVRAQVELREVQSEDLDLAPEVGEAAVGDTPRVVGAEALVDELELTAQLVDLERVAAEPLPDRAQPAAVRLVVVLIRWDVGDLSDDRRRVDERRRHAPGARQLAHVVAQEPSRELASLLERDLDRVRAGMWVAVEVAADPRAEPRHDGRLGCAPAQLAEQVRGRLPERLLEEPQTVPDLVDDMRPAGPQLVGLPEDRHFFREPAADPRDRRRRQLGAVELAQELRDPPVRAQHGSPRRLGRM